jgi:hypothetical protein
MATFHTAVQDLVSALRHGPAEEVPSYLAEALRASEHAGPEEASWALLAVVELLADPECGAAGRVALFCTQCVVQGASPWVATGLTVERLCAALQQPRDDLPFLCMAAGPLLSHFSEARELFRALGGTPERLLALSEGAEPVEGLARLLEEHAGGSAPAEPLGAAADAALARLAEASARGPGAREETSACLQELIRSLFCVDRTARDRALAGLGRLVADRDFAYVGEFAQTCGILVETGCDAAQAIDPVLGRLSDTLRAAETFLAACLDEGQTAGGPEEDRGPRELVEEYGPRVAGRLPAEARAFEATGPLCLGAIALLARLPQKRKQVRHDTALLGQAHTLAAVSGPAGLLTRMLQVLDDEELLILSPEHRVGFRVRIRGIGDNFQLHTLLAGSIIGPAEEGLYPGLVGTIRDGHATPAQPGRPLDWRAVGVARDLPCTRDEAAVWSHLQLWTYQALQPDGRLPDNPLGRPDLFVYNEGVPADIPPFEGVRVVLLGDVSFSRSWNGVRVFPFMAADLGVEATLSAAEVDGWLGRIAAAARAGKAASPGGG